jgi:hypothetical protein
MFFEKVEVGAKGARALTTKTYSHASLRLDFDKDNGAPNEKKRMRPPRERHHLNQGKGPKVKQLIKHVRATNVPLETPPNYQTETSINKS